MDPMYVCIGDNLLGKSQRMSALSIDWVKLSSIIWIVWTADDISMKDGDCYSSPDKNQLQYDWKDDLGNPIII